MNEALEKHQAHELIERLPDAQIATVIRFLQFILLDSVTRALATAPPDDEPVTDQDRGRFHGGQAWFAQRGGKGIPMRNVVAECGFKLEEFPLDRRARSGPSYSHASFSK